MFDLTENFTTFSKIILRQPILKKTFILFLSFNVSLLYITRKSFCQMNCEIDAYKEKKKKFKRRPFYFLYFLSSIVYDRYLKKDVYHSSSITVLLLLSIAKQQSFDNKSSNRQFLRSLNGCFTKAKMLKYINEQIWNFYRICFFFLFFFTRKDTMCVICIDILFNINEISERCLTFAFRFRKQLKNRLPPLFNSLSTAMFYSFNSYIFIRYFQIFTVFCSTK